MLDVATLQERLRDTGARFGEIQAEPLQQRAG
jgi:hypothetical protein